MNDDKDETRGAQMAVRRKWLFMVGMFVLLAILVWLDEILDLPHLLLGGPPTPVNWGEAIMETILLAIVGALLFQLSRDVIARRRAEAALQRSEDRYRRLVESSGDLIFSVDRAGVFRTAGGGRLRGLDLQPKDVVGGSLDDLFSEEEARRYRERHHQVFESGTTMTYEHTFEFAGVTRTDLTTIYPVKDERGEVKVVGIICRDITARKQAEEEREQLIAELQDALDHVKQLSGLLPICASCKKIRDDQGYWQQVEVYVRDHSEAEFTHGICPECAHKMYPDIFDENGKPRPR